MSNSKTVERLFPFALRARIIVPGGDSVLRLERKLEFAFLATDLAQGSRKEIESRLQKLPCFSFYTAAELQQFFRVPGAKVLGFKKSSLARSILKELKQLSGPEPAGLTPLTGD